MTEEQSHDDVRRMVREAYGRTARAHDASPPEDTSAPAPSGCCGSAEPAQSTELKPAEAATGCCGPAPARADDASTRAGARSRAVGYSAEELESIPEGADLGLGCGNPAAIAAMQPGETVLDLGSGAGIDCFLAAKQVGGSGKVIGVDMTPEMLAKARANQAKVGADNVEFRLGEIEHMPVADDSVDVVISNCVINLSPDKPTVYAEAFRVLKPGGRLAISDVVVTAPLPEELRQDPALLAGCVAGAATVDELEVMLAEAGFEQVTIAPKESSRAFIREWAPGRKLEDVIRSATIEGIKPR